MCVRWPGQTTRTVFVEGLLAEGADEESRGPSGLEESPGVLRVVARALHDRARGLRHDLVVGAVQQVRQRQQAMSAADGVLAVHCRHP